MRVEEPGSSIGDVMSEGVNRLPASVDGDLINWEAINVILGGLPDSGRVRCKLRVL